MLIASPIRTDGCAIDRIIGVGLPVLLIHWGQHAEIRARLRPISARLAAAYAGRALIVELDADENPDLVRRYGIAQLPALVLIDAGRTVARFGGFVTEHTLESWLEHVCTGAARPHDVANRRAAREPAGGGGAASGVTITGTAQQTSDGPRVLTDGTFDVVVGGARVPVLVDFWAEWCGPCQAVAPAVERLAAEFAGRAIVAKVDVDANRHLSQRFGIVGIPTLCIFRRGEIVERLVGVQSLPTLRRALARHVAA